MCIGFEVAYTWIEPYNKIYAYAVGSYVQYSIGFNVGDPADPTDEAPEYTPNKDLDDAEKALISCVFEHRRTSSWVQQALDRMADRSQKPHFRHSFNPSIRGQYTDSSEPNIELSRRKIQEGADGYNLNDSVEQERILHLKSEAEVLIQ